MALIIQNGYPVLKLDIGNGPDQVINKKFVSDNNWYQFIVERYTQWNQFLRNFSLSSIFVL